MLTLIDSATYGSAGTGGGVLVPRGPRGLWGALATVSTPRIDAKALPVVDIALLGAAARGTMFDYDPALAISLGEETDPHSLLG